MRKVFNMLRVDQIRDWVKKYELGYYFDPGGMSFFCPAFKDIKPCHTSEYIDIESGKYKDDRDFNKLKNWVEENAEKFMSPKPKEYTYYSEGIIEKIYNG